MKRKYGTGSIYQTRGKWVAKWNKDGKIVYSYGHTSRESAERMLQDAVLPIIPVQTPATIGFYFEKWIQNRKITHVSWKDDEYRWKKHLSCWNDKLPEEITVPIVKTLVQSKLKDGLSQTTVGLIIKLASSFYSDLVDDGVLDKNLFRYLPKSVKRLLRSRYDWRSTPFIDSLDKVQLILDRLEGEPKLAFALGVYTGCRPSELLALSWEDIDLINNRITVRYQMKDGKLVLPKDKESRIVPVQQKLMPYLKNNLKGLILPNSTKIGLRADLKKVLKNINHPLLTWYQATRHTMASLYLLKGGSIERLSKIMGHCDIKLTQRYSHLKVDNFPQSDYTLLGTT